MAGFFAKIDTINIDFPKFTKAMERDCKKLLRLGAQRWLITVLGRIPVRTGFLAGAFTPLEDLVGVVQRDTATGKALGRIKPSRNPLLTREKKLDFYRKTLKKLEDSIKVDERSLEKLKEGMAALEENIRSGSKGHTGENFVSAFKPMDAIAQEKLRQLHRQIREDKRALQIQWKIDRVKRRIAKMENKMNQTKGRKRMYKYVDKETEGFIRKDKSGRKTTHPISEYPIAGGTKIEVIRNLEKIRKLLVRTMKQKDRVYNPVLGKRTGTYTFRNSKGEVITKDKGDRYHRAYVKEYVRVKRMVEQEQKQEQKAISALDRLRAKKQAKDKIQTRVMKEIEERVWSGKYIEKRRLIQVAKEYHVFKEYYRHTDKSKTLKTPRSGVRFATPADKIFNEFAGEERSKFEEKINMISQMQASVESVNRFREKFAATQNAESTIKGIIDKAGKIEGMYGPGTIPEYMRSTSVPVVGSSAADEMKKTYEDIMRKTRTEKMFFSFTFNVRITYWEINDNKLGWHSSKLGNIAFLRFMKEAVNSKTQFRALTNIQDFFVRRSIRFDGTTGSTDTIRQVFRGANT